MTSIRPESAEDLYLQGLDLLAADSPAEAARAFREAIHADAKVAAARAHSGVEDGTSFFWRRGLSAVSAPGQHTPAERLRGMHDQLAAAYGAQHWWPAQTPFEMILGAYLTQNTAWKAVERSLGNLRAAGALTVEGLRLLPFEELRRLIQPSGFSTRKAPALKAFVKMLDEEFGGSLENLAAIPTAALRTRLLELPGVGPETADAILLYALGHPVPVADEYLRRISERHQLLMPAPSRNRKGYDAMADLTCQAFASDAAEEQARLFNEFHALTVAVGKAHCRKTAHCVGCPLAADLDVM